MSQGSIVSETIFDLDHVEYRYPGGGVALRDVTFSIAAGERVALLGANGSGKSTLLHLLDGLYFASRGSVSAFGTRLTEQTVDTPPFSGWFRRQVAFLFQNSDAQLFCARVDEELAYGPLQLRLPPAEVEQRVSDVLQLLEIGHLRTRPPQQLSEGEKKKVALASVLTTGPRVLLLDEPSSGLDPRTQQWLVEFLNELHSAGVTLITASHDLALVADIADRAAVLSEDHRLVRDAPCADVLADTDLLLSVNLIHTHVHAHGAMVHAHAHRHDSSHEHEHPI
jgi:cobalt/nickel transport system ATP-binding protein